MKYYLTDEAKQAGCEFKKPREGDAGYDLYASEDVELRVGEVKKIPTGVYLAFPKTRVGLIQERGKVSQHGLAIRARVVDSIYRGEVFVVMQYIPNRTFLVEVLSFALDALGQHRNKRPPFVRRAEELLGIAYKIKAGDKIAQILDLAVNTRKPTEVNTIEALGKTERGDGGFGSTGR